MYIYIYHFQMKWKDPIFQTSDSDPSIPAHEL
jgi:hypothetical protein